MTLSRSILTLVLALCLSQALHTSQACGSETLRSLTPSGVGLYVEVDDLAGNRDRLLQNALVKRWLEFPPLAKFRQQSLPAIRLITDQIALQVGLKPTELEAVLSGSMALAVWPEIPEAEGETPGVGLLLVEGAEPELLQKALSGINAASVRMGDVTRLEERTRGGVKYTVRHVRRGGHDSLEFTAVVGKVAVVTNRESTLHKVFDLKGAGTTPAATGAMGSLAADPRFRQAAAHQPRAGWRVYLDGRPWTELLEAALDKADRTDAEAVASLAGLVGVSRAIQYAVVTGENDDRSLTIAAHAAIDRGRLDERGAALLTAISGPAKQLRLVPRDALAAWAGRFQAAPLVKLVYSLQSEEDRREMLDFKNAAAAVLGGLDPVADLLPALGPEIGAYIVPAQEPAPGEAPLEAVIALEVHDPEPTGAAKNDPSRPRVPTAVENAMRTLCAFGAVAHNAEHKGHAAVSKTLTRDGISYTWLEGLVGAPPGVTPGYALAHGQLLLGTSRTALIRGARLAASGAERTSESLAAALEQGELADVLPSGFRDPSHVVVLNLTAARQFLTTRRPQVVEVLARLKSTTADKVEKGLVQLEAILSLADHVVAADRVTNESISTLVRISAGK